MKLFIYSPTHSKKSNDRLTKAINEVTGINTLDILLLDTLDNFESFLALAGGLSPSALAGGFLAAAGGLSVLRRSVVSGVSELGTFSIAAVGVSESPAVGFFGSSDINVSCER